MSVIVEALRRCSWLTTTTTSSHRSQHISTLKSPPLYFKVERLIVVLWMVLNSIILLFVLGGFNEPTPIFKADSLMVYPTVNSTHIHSRMAIAFSVNSPFIYNFEDVQVSVFYKEEKISTSMARSLFPVRDQHKILMKARIVVSADYIDDLVAEALAADWSQGTVNFTFMVNAVARRRPRFKGKIRMNASCLDLKVEFPSNMKYPTGTMLDRPIECNVQFVP